MKNLLIIQTGRLGDTILALPIAYHYKKEGYNVDWIILKDYLGAFDGVDYVNPIVIPDTHNVSDSAIPLNINNSVQWAYLYYRNHVKDYQKMIDLSIYFPGTRTVLPVSSRNFVEAKYILANAPITSCRDLKRVPNVTREDMLYDKVVGDKKDYILIHNQGSDGKIEFDLATNSEVVYFSPIPGFTIYDWYKVIDNAKEIHCLDSCLINYIETLIPRSSDSIIGKRIIGIENKTFHYHRKKFYLTHPWFETPRTEKLWLIYE